jgi:hypothetical protein
LLRPPPKAQGRQVPPGIAYPQYRYYLYRSIPYQLGNKYQESLIDIHESYRLPARRCGDKSRLKGVAREEELIFCVTMAFIMSKYIRPTEGQATVFLLYVFISHFIPY